MSELRNVCYFDHKNAIWSKKCNLVKKCNLAKKIKSCQKKCNLVDQLKCLSRLSQCPTEQTPHGLPGVCSKWWEESLVEIGRIDCNSLIKKSDGSTLVTPDRLQRFGRIATCPTQTTKQKSCRLIYIRTPRRGAVKNKIRDYLGFFS